MKSDELAHPNDSEDVADAASESEEDPKASRRGIRWTARKLARVRSSHLAERTSGMALSGILVLLVIAPIAILGVGAVITTRPLNIGEAELTWSHLQGLIQPHIFESVRNTLVIGFFATVLATAFGVLLAVFLSRTNMPGSRSLSKIIFTSMFVPPFIGAIGWIVLSTPRVGYLHRYLPGWDFDIRTIGGMIVVMTIYYVPLVILVVTPPLERMDGALEEAAAVSGSKRLDVFRKVTVPLVAPATMGAALLVFIGAISNFGVPLILGFPVGIPVITTQIYRSIAIFPANYNAAASLALLLLVLTITGIFLQRRVARRGTHVVTSGKGSKPSQIDLGRVRIAATSVVVVYCLAAVVLPITGMVLSSLLPYFSTDVALPKSLEHYQYVLFDHPTVIPSAINSVMLGIGAGVIGAVFAAFVAYLSLRGRFLPGRIAGVIAMLPISIPHMVLAVGMLWAWLTLGLPTGSLLILLVAYVTVFLPYAYQTVSGRLVQLDRSLEEAAFVSGSSWTSAFRKVTLPLLMPGMISGGFLMFVFAFRELTASILLSSPGNSVISVVIFDIFSEGRYTQLFAVATLQILFTLFLIWVAGQFGIKLQRDALEKS